MHVHCSTCGEPWGAHHLWHDAIWDTGLSEPEVRVWKDLPQSKKLTRKWRTEFEAAGYYFGQTLINVIRCPVCPKGAQPDEEKVQLKAELEKLLEGDEDGLAAKFEDHWL
jgi:hypothetical protein